MTTLHGIEVKVGDKVWDCVRGWSKVTGINYSKYYPIETEKSTYNSKGFVNAGSKFPSIFWQEFKIPDNAFVKPKVMVKKYIVLYGGYGTYHTTATSTIVYFASKDAFCKLFPNLKFISLILESEIEVEE